jgi:aminomethyltransferase
MASGSGPGGIVDADKEVVGTVTSGGPGISVPGGIGLAYVPTRMAKAGTQLTIDCRGKPTPATVVSGKFYKRAAT